MEKKEMSEWFKELATFMGPSSFIILIWLVIL